MEAYALRVSYRGIVLNRRGCDGGIVAGRHSDRTGDRSWHIFFCALIAAVGYGVAAIVSTPMLEFTSICVGVFGIWSIFGVFWAYAGDLLGGAASAGGLALINSVGSLGGLVAPNLLAFVRQASGSFNGSLLVLAGFALITGILAAFLRPLAPDMARPPAVQGG